MHNQLRATQADCRTDGSRPGSLVLGGYDLNCILGKLATFAFRRNSNALFVTVSAIAIDYQPGSGKSQAATTKSFEAILDSTLPYLFLPRETCDELEKMLNLRYDDATNLYLLSPKNLTINKAAIENLRFQINGDTEGNGIVISFPYLAFESNASWTWGWDGDQPIFPLRRTNSTTAVLGRVFFQEAYVIADYEKDVFMISQVNTTTSSEFNLTSILGNPNATSNASTEVVHPTGLSGGAIAGIAIGIVVLIVSLTFSIWFFILKPKRTKTKAEAFEIAAGENERPAVNRDRSDTMNSIYSGGTAVSELPVSPADGFGHRPSHRRLPSNVSELSASGSDGETYHARRGTVGSTLGYIDEMRHKSGAAELEANMREQQRASTPMNELPTPMTEIPTTPMNELPGDQTFKS